MVTIPVIDLEKFEAPEEVKTGVEDVAGGSQTIGVVGLGHCGSRLVEAFHALGYKKCLAYNTAEADLEPINIPDQQKILLDIGQQGAAKDTAIGAKAIQKYKEDIYDHLSEVLGEVDRVVICFGIGGGTGGGGFSEILPVVRRYLDDLPGITDVDRRITVLTTLPSETELRDKRVAKNTWVGLSAVANAAKDRVSPALVIDNGRIRKLYPGIPAKGYWRTVNSTIASLFHVFNVLSAQSSEYENFDPADYHTILAAGGFAVMGVATVRDFDTKEALASAMRDGFRKALLAEDFNLETAKACGVIAVGGESVLRVLPQESIDYGMGAVSKACGGAVTYRGIYEDTKETLRVFTLISGLFPPAPLIARLRRVVPVDELDDFEIWP